MDDINKLKMDIIKKVVNITDVDKLLEMLDAAKSPRPRKVKFKHGVLIDGFGIRCGVYVWSTISRIPPASFERYLANGMTVEEIFEYRQCPPPTEEQKNKVRETIRPPESPARRIPKDSPAGVWDLHEGFGRKYTCRQWSFVAGLHHNTFRRYLKKGMTVEEIFEYRQCDPPEWTE